MNANEQLIRKIAEEMAIKKYNDFRGVMAFPGFRWSELPITSKESHIENCILCARIAVKYMAEEFEAAWIMAFDGERDQIEYSQYMDECRIIMIKRGLIPPTEKELI